ncbi:MAG: DUF805 domain-containing protein [Oscillospiraceae bacterium]|nr:DUF805 domain-containing protein [Oscillospiraceae bacterium]
MKYIAEMWKRIFDYKGKSGRKEYWIPFAVNAVIAVLVTVFMLVRPYAEWVFVPAIVLAAYLAVSFIPFISLTVRRLHDTGKSGWWYLVSFILGVGAVVVIFMCAGSSGTFSPDLNYAAGVYGPPPFDDEYDPSDNMHHTMYGPPMVDKPPVDNIGNDFTDVTFEPEENIPVDVYGPPPLDGDPVEEETETSSETEETPEETAEVPEETAEAPDEFKPVIFEPSENIVPAVYGPPEFFE